MRTGTFNDAAAAAEHPERRFRRVAFDHQPTLDDIGLERVIRRFPFVPNDPAQLDEDCYEAFNIQVEGLARRFQATSGNHMIIGRSEEHTSELQSLMSNSYAVFGLKKKKQTPNIT